MTRWDFWAGIAVIVASMWLLGMKLKQEFFQRMNAHLDFLYRPERSPHPLTLSPQDTLTENEDEVEQVRSEIVEDVAIGAGG